MVPGLYFELFWGQGCMAMVQLPLLNQVNKCILDISKVHNISFINSDNIIRNDMYTDGLHLLHSGKSL